MHIIFLFLIEVFFGVLTTLIFEFVLKTNKKLRNRYYRRHQIVFGYHTHHSIYGIMFMLAGVVLYFAARPTGALFCVAFGIGIVIMHTLSSGKLVFIEKQR